MLLYLGNRPLLFVLPLKMKTQVEGKAFYVFIWTLTVYCSYSVIQWCP